MGEHVLAKADLEQALRLDPENAPTYCYEQGNVYSELSDHDRAIAEFDEAIRLNPEFAEAYHNRGITNTRGFRLDEAIADFDRAIQLSPSDPEVFAGRASAYAAKGEHCKTISDYTHAIGLDPNYAIAYRLWAHSYECEGKFDLAIADLTQVIRLAPADSENYVARGQLYSIKNQHAEAVADCDQAVALNPRDASALMMRGDSHARQWEDGIELYLMGYDLQRNVVGQESAIRVWSALHVLTYDSAIEDYRRCSSIHPKNKDIKTFVEIIVKSTQAIKTDPKDGFAYYARGGAYRFFRHGTLDLAIANYTQAIDIAWHWASRNHSTIFNEVVQDQYPYLADSYQSRGKAHAALDEWGLAKDDFNMANRLAGISVQHD